MPRLMAQRTALLPPVAGRPWAMVQISKYKADKADLHGIRDGRVVLAKLQHDACLHGWVGAHMGLLGCSVLARSTETAGAQLTFIAGSLKA